MAKPTNPEIEQLKQQLNEKVGEFRDIYNKVLEKGGEELSDDILEAVTGGNLGAIPTYPPTCDPTTTTAEEDR